MLRKGEADALLVVKLDRLTRSVRDLGDLVSDYFAKGAALLSVSEQIDTRSAAGRLVLNVLASVSQWEREAIGERTAVAMQHKAASGEYTGGRIPFGFALGEDGVTLIRDESEQATIDAARALAAEGLSLRAIAGALASRAILARNGRPFAASQVARLLASDKASEERAA
jgi:DNA invertase Pin-like site-specific DNA recombinase